MAVRKDEMWDDEERPEPGPLAWDRVTAQGNVNLPQGPANAAQDGEQAHEQGDAKGQLHYERQVTKKSEVRQDHVFQHSLIEAKGRMLRLRPEPVGQPSKALPLRIDDPGSLLQRRLQPQHIEHDTEEPDKKPGQPLGKEVHGLFLRQCCRTVSHA